jgi:hypothetical protein
MVWGGLELESRELSLGETPLGSNHAERALYNLLECSTAYLWSTVERRFQHCSVSGCPLRCLRSCIPSSKVFHVQERLGLPKFFDASLPACHGLWTPADLPLLAMSVGRVLPSGALKPSASATSLFEAVPALQGARSPLRPTGYAVYASPILFTVSPRLRHGRKTRYGWVASPYPTGTFTLQEMPSFSWRDYAGPQPLPEAAAQHRL